MPRVAGERAYRMLLGLYPAAFRRRYTVDMLEFYRERMREAARGGGTLRPFAVWLQLVPDLVASALAERFTWLHRDMDRAPAIVRTYSARREDTMSMLMQDVRFAARSMARRPMFSAIVLATLALGIGANAAIFTVVNAVLLRPLPFAHVDRIVDLSHEAPYSSVSEPEFIDYERGVPGLARLAAYNTPSILLAGGDGDPIRTYASRVSRDFFGIVGVRPFLGRVFVPDEFSPLSRARVAVIGHTLWVQQFGSDPQVVGKTLTISGTPVTIVGVMPAGYTFPDIDASLWLPWRLNPDSLWTRNNHYLRLVGLMLPNSSLSQVRAQVRTLESRWPAMYPETYMPGKPVVGVVTPIRDVLLGPTQPYLLALLAAVGFILLIACVNVANLLLVRGESRRKELAVRVALGASHGRIVRQMLTESMFLALLGAVLGTALAWLGTRVLASLAPADLPRIDQVGIDGRVVTFTIAMTVLTGVVFGAVPALQARRGATADTLREGGKTSAHGVSGVTRRALVITEITLAVVMLSGAGLLVRSLMRLQAMKLGFDPAGAMTMQVTVPRTYGDTTADTFMSGLLIRLAGLPGVTSAGAVGALPISGSDNTWSIMIDNHVLKTIAESPGATPEQVTPDYFRAMRIALVRGRLFTRDDRMGAAPVAVISEAMAKQVWPGVDPIGHTLKMFNEKSPWVTIVGIVRDVRSRGIQQESPPTMYFPYSQTGSTAYSMPTSMTAVVRSANDPASLAAGMRAAVRALDANVAISRVATMRSVVGDSIASRRFATVLLAGFAALALILSGIGIYGVVSYGVSQRTYEIGVRVAMGASPRAIMRLVLEEGVRMAAIGLLLGLIGAVAVDRLLTSLLVGVSGHDAATFAGVSLVLALVAASACVMPARRATAVSPTEALRNG
ncbi:MAG TPA: ABC transporter permease [Gemmatimonadaceae bacterium]|nr:ABC transporter permease [Gemmatimonadaceae bacterium]